MSTRHAKTDKTGAHRSTTPGNFLALVGLLGCTFAHDGPISRRKTMGFGPVHPHAKFHTIARSFVTVLLSDQLSGDNGFALRKDSYTDKATGVTHVFFRQMINGIEVADGDINVNVKDGAVISYGDSFYRGGVPSISLVDESITPGPHADFCDLLQDRLAERFNLFRKESVATDQITMAVLPHKDETLDRMHRLHSWNCEHVRTPYEFAERGFVKRDDIVDPRNALLQFMVAATPHDAVVAEILDKHDQISENMTSWFEAHFIGDDYATLVEMIDNVPDAVSPVKAKPVYIQLPDGDRTMLMQAWRFEVEMRDNWYEAVVSRQAPHRIFSVVDWASDAPVPSEPTQRPPATTSLCIRHQRPSEGNRSFAKENSIHWPVLSGGTLSLLPTTSFLHLKKDEYSNYTITFGNNVWFPSSSLERYSIYTGFAHENWEGQYNWLQNYRPDGGEQLGGDAVIANAQDGSGFNNANFMTPPDGQNGRREPLPDGDLEAGIVIHELSHGLSIRLTGGPANSGCLGWGESGGMGEGWGDFLATIIRSKADYSDFPMGAWAANQAKGIRNYPYSLDNTINPSTYKTLDKPGYWGVHAIGEVWAEMLWVVSQRLIAKHGFVDSLFPPLPLEDGTIPTGDFYRSPETLSSDVAGQLVPKHGNSLVVKLVLDAMKLQHAARVLTGGENFCDLWLAFAEKGLGMDATVQGRTPWGGGIRSDVSIAFLHDT
ncbi:Fungalysin metallopeptidase-domain-containing protein [Russula vinacea]|nr:Fungalysin metallopeptidase-domain-containing protein [Russula vinacea]